MSDERDGRDGPDRQDGRNQRDVRDRRNQPEEPLGDLAEEVRERTGERPPGERGERAGSRTREGPLADVAAEVDERRRRDRDETDAFESVEVGDLDGEQLWERLAEGDDGPTVTVSPDAADATGATDWSDDRDVRTIPTATCHGCPYFGDPPDLACTHEGTEILAMPDTDHFRVADCPMVVDGEEDVRGIGVESDDGSE
ncbi:hypothetical protein [Halorussus salinisoli]|uniref:hypothetical protein n=1 Tax=Halorussus salinisoli TaxID=2558242 RepID=UPI002A90DFDD|nr:hypothetical protein [Halorussus salinisoli]